MIGSVQALHAADLLNEQADGAQSRRALCAHDHERATGQLCDDWHEKGIDLFPVDDRRRERGERWEKLSPEVGADPDNSSQDDEEKNHPTPRNTHLTLQRTTRASGSSMNIRQT